MMGVVGDVVDDRRKGRRASWQLSGLPQWQTVVRPLDEQRMSAVDEDLDLELFRQPRKKVLGIVCDPAANRRDRRYHGQPGPTHGPAARSATKAQGSAARWVPFFQLRRSVTRKPSSTRAPQSRASDSAELRPSRKSTPSRERTRLASTTKVRASSVHVFSSIPLTMSP